MKTICGSPAYVAPEILKKKGYGREVDMWAVGVITYFLLCGEFPFFDDNRDVMFKKILMGHYSFPENTNEFHLSDTAKDFIRRILVTNPSTRMTASQALKHEWLQIQPNHAKKRSQSLFLSGIRRSKVDLTLVSFKSTTPGVVDTFRDDYVGTTPNLRNK
eukprot:c18988_g1_i1.p1 GENE.c18988_g1_i1~~c18988_g1_i1.p1  ORF type:complete len:160 (+),score=44.30 c18988_g1_i1:102-581(+)